VVLLVRRHRPLEGVHQLVVVGLDLQEHPGHVLLLGPLLDGQGLGPELLQPGVVDVREPGRRVVELFQPVDPRLVPLLERHDPLVVLLQRLQVLVQLDLLLDQPGELGLLAHEAHVPEPEPADDQQGDQGRQPGQLAAAGHLRGDRLPRGGQVHRQSPALGLEGQQAGQGGEVPAGVRRGVVLDPGQRVERLDRDLQAGPDAAAPPARPGRLGHVQGLDRLLRVLAVVDGQVPPQLAEQHRLGVQRRGRHRPGEHHLPVAGDDQLAPLFPAGQPGDRRPPALGGGDRPGVDRPVQGG
jgi:hypothetical protein